LFRGWQISYSTCNKLNAFLFITIKMNLLISVFLFILLFLEIFMKYIYALPLSIVVPVYNTASYLDRCINSILNQIFKDFKLICVDDGSTDNSMEILEKFKMTDNKVKIIHSEKNNGASVQETQELKMQKENLLDLLIVMTILMIDFMKIYFKNPVIIILWLVTLYLILIFLNYIIKEAINDISQFMTQFGERSF